MIPKYESNLTIFIILGCDDKSKWEIWKNLFHCEYFKVKCVEDEHTVELCGALKVSDLYACFVSFMIYLSLHFILVLNIAIFLVLIQYIPKIFYLSSLV